MTFPTNHDADRVAYVYRLGAEFMANPPTEGELMARTFGDRWPPRHRLMLGERVAAVLVALGLVGFVLTAVWQTDGHPGGFVVAFGSASLVLLMLGVPWAPTPRRVREVWRCWRRR